MIKSKSKSEEITLAGVTLTFTLHQLGDRQEPVAYHEGEAYRLVNVPADPMRDLTHVHDAEVLGQRYRVFVAPVLSVTAKVLGAQPLSGPFGAVVALEANGERLALRRDGRLDRTGPGTGRATKPVHVRVDLYTKIADLAAARKWTLSDAASFVMDAGFRTLEQNQPVKKVTELRRI